MNTESDNHIALEKGDDQAASKSPLRRILGLVLILVSSFIFSSSATGAKYLEGIPPGQFSMARGGYALLLLVPTSFHSGISLLCFPKPALVAVRCIVHGLGYCLKIWCVKNMKIGDATAIYFTGPIFAGIFSRIFLKEKYTLINVFSTISGITGVVLIAKPSFIFGNSTGDVGYSIVYCLIALGAAIMAGIGYSSQRGLGNSVSPVVTTFYMNATVFMGGALLNLLSGATYSLPTCYTERGILTACGIGACIGLVLLNKGLSIEKSAPATLMRNMDIVLAFVVQVFLFNEKIEWRSVLGALLILTSAASVAFERAFCPNYFCQI